jgi:hypothetical protein
LSIGAGSGRCRAGGISDPAVRYVVLDALSEQDLLTQGVALREMKLVSGGSGLAIGLARDWAQRHGARVKALWRACRWPARRWCSRAPVR